MHDVSISGGVNIGCYDQVWLDRSATRSRKGFVRFDWVAGFRAATGVTVASDLVDARFSLTGEFGDVAPIELRRVLQKWSDVTVTDPDFVTAGRTTWSHRIYNSNPWNQAGAAALGGTGTVASDYNGSFDLAATIDATVTPSSINQPAAFAGPLVTDAFRFWFANPTLDYGYGLQHAGPASNELRFMKTELGLGDRGPVLTTTYLLPAVSGPSAPSEVSGPAAPLPLHAVKEGGDVHFHFQDLGAAAATYSVYEGSIGTWFSHAGAACNITPGSVASGRDFRHTPAAGSRYFQ